jgi:hypothetical protein
MPAANFPEYAHAISSLLTEIVSTGNVQLRNLQLDQRSTMRGYIAGILVFADVSELHFREFVDITQLEPRLMYAYHYQDAAGTLLFRYDNALHRPMLSQCEHRHTPAGIDVGVMPTLAAVIDEILG